MTNEQLFIYLTAIIRRLENVVLDIDNLGNPGERDKKYRWVGNGPEPFIAGLVSTIVGESLPEGYELIEVGMNAAAQQVDAFVDDLKEEIAFLVGGK